MNAKIACLDCGYPSVLTFACFIQDDHEREDRLPGLLSAEGEDEDGRPASRLRRRSA